ncbi:hypothetical protein KC207_04820 [Phycicoccus sp. BSK3Z-2]|uniref:Bacterial Ig-like domain-containing protein n=1 Tax=Phycicoccus avicenniae TaxID=2828860 RepID=A0A941D7M5_9MICO|nr:hypothetical protein [Phycicoccus avicenniae]MBR7742608.1 hypothetical protein [Phycicoccus avicenniae]
MTVTPARRTLSSLTALVVLLVVALTLPSAHADAPVVTGSETDLGVQIPGQLTGLRSEDSDQGTVDGRHLTFFVNNGGSGNKARFFAMDLAGKMVAEIHVPQGTDVKALAYSPGTKSVFLAANSATYAFVYEWDGERLTKVGSIANQAVVRIAAAADGAVYLGTYAPSNGRLFRYRGGTLSDLGQPMSGESYVRSLAVDSANVWVSNYRSSAAKLVRVNRSTGARTTIATPAAFSSQWSAFHMTRAGDYLFLRMVNEPRLFAYDTVRNRFESFDDQVARDRAVPETPNVRPYIDGISPYGISPLMEGRYVYFQRSGAGIMRVDLEDGLKAIRVDKWHGSDNTNPWPSASVPGPVSYAWLSGVAGRSGHSLVTTTIDAKVYVNTPGQSAPVVMTLPARDAPSLINRLGTDERGNVLAGGFDLPEGVGSYSPSSGATTILNGPQMEGFGSFGSSTVMGGYTGNSSSSAPLYVHTGTGQPTLRTYINNSQERPVAMVQVGQRMAIGTVPIKNQLGGALSLWNPSTNALTVKRNLIPDHSIISLASQGDLVVGGSSNTGGTGSTPAGTVGKIFTYDTGSGALKTFTPPGASSATYSWVAAITPDPTQTNHYWALSTGYLIQFKVSSTGSITLTRNLGAFPNTSSPTGKELGIAIVDGTLFATVGQGLSAINPVTGEQTVLASKTATGPVSGLVKVGASSLYYARGARLYEYRVGSATSTASLAAPVVTSPDVSAPVAPGSIAFAGTGTKNSTVEVSDGSRTRSALVRDDGTWELAGMDFPSGSHDLTFTATMSGFAPRTTTVTLTVSTTTGDRCSFAKPVPTNIAVGGYNPPNKDYAFEGTGTPGTLVTMESGSRTRTATVRDDGTWSMNPVWFGWWSGMVPFTASREGCASRTNEVTAWFVEKPSYHVPTLLISHTESDWYSGGDIAFKGKGTPGALVTFLIGNQTRFAAVSSTGRWTMRAVAVSDAPVSFQLLSELPGYADQTASFDVHFGEAPTSVAAPLVTSHSQGSTVRAGDVVFSGKGTPRTKISLTTSGRTVTTYVRESGRWDLPSLPLGTGTTTLRFTASSPNLYPASSALTVSATP